MTREHEPSDQILEERLNKAPGSVLTTSLIRKLLDDSTAGDPRFSNYRRAVATPISDRQEDMPTDTFPDASPSRLMTKIAERVPTMSPVDFSAVAGGISGIGHFSQEMLAPTFVLGIIQISEAIGTRRAVDKMNDAINVLRTPKKL